MSDTWQASSALNTHTRIINAISRYTDEDPAQFSVLIHPDPKHAGVYAVRVRHYVDAGNGKVGAERFSWDAIYDMNEDDFNEGEFTQWPPRSL